MKKRLLPLVGLTLATLIAAACSGAAPTRTGTPSPTPSPTSTSIFPPTVTYVEGRFESGSTTGKEITVPMGSRVGVHLVLDATGNMGGELKVEVWKHIALSPDTSVQTCAKAATLQKGAREVYACDFTAEDLTSRKFTQYYLKAYWNGVALTVEPRVGEGVRTLPGSTTISPTLSPIKEWNLERIQVYGSTITVLLRVYAGIDVRVTLDGRGPDHVNTPVPILEFVFEDVPAGGHTIWVSDVVGFELKAEVVVPTTTARPIENPKSF